MAGSPDITNRRGLRLPDSLLPRGVPLYRVWQTQVRVERPELIRRIHAERGRGSNIDVKGQRNIGDSLRRKERKGSFEGTGDISKAQIVENSRPATQRRLPPSTRADLIRDTEPRCKAPEPTTKQRRPFGCQPRALQDAVLNAKQSARYSFVRLSGWRHTLEPQAVR